MPTPMNAMLLVIPCRTQGQAGLVALHGDRERIGPAQDIAVVDLQDPPDLGVLDDRHVDRLALDQADHLLTGGQEQDGTP